MLAINIACSQCKAVQQFDHFPASGESLRCNQCGALLKTCTGWIGPASNLGRRDAKGPDALHPSSMNRARAAAAVVVGSLVLLLVGVALTALLFQPGGNAAAQMTETAKPPVVAVAVAEKHAVIPAPAPAAVGPADQAPAKGDLDRPAPPQPETAKQPAREPELPELELPPPAAPPPPANTPLTPEQKRINGAIDRGVKFMKTTQYNSGRWDVGNHPVGYAALPGLTLLECGVPAADPAVQRAAKFVRGHAPTLTATYELSLAILFLDRLGDSRDRALIQTLAIRLIAGQNAAGGWTYDCPALSRADHQHLLGFLRRQQTHTLMDPLHTAADSLNPLGKDVATALQDPLRTPAPGPLPNPIQKPTNPQSVTPSEPEVAAPGNLVQPPDNNAPAAADKKKKTPTPSTKSDSLPAHLKGLAVVRMKDEAAKRRGARVNPKTKGILGGASGDNSNTQFAMLALWVARRHGVPMERTLALVDQRFQTSQNGDGGWGYHIDGPAAFTKPSMTCVGLLGLAIGHGFAQETAAGLKSPKEAAPPRRGEQDPAIQRGLQRLGEYLDAPQRIRLAGGQIDLYTLWSIERVGVLYDLKTIGTKDWYAWSARLLVANQNADGSWWGRGYHGSSPTIDTCLALLILKRTNLVQDLSESLRLLGITEPDIDSRVSGDR